MMTKRLFKKFQTTVKSALAATDSNEILSMAMEEDLRESETVVWEDAVTSSPNPDSTSPAWIDSCTDPMASFQSNRNYFNQSNFDFVSGGCGFGQLWLMCKGINTSSACYSDTDLIDFSQSIPPKYAYPIYGIVFPCLVSLAIVANIFVLLVLSQKHMQSPTNAILLYMAVADLFVGIVPLPFTLFWFTLRAYTTPEILTPFWCYIYHYMMDTVPPVCHNIAIWLTVLLAAQRYLHIEFPLRAHYYCTIADVRRAMIIIVVISILCGSMKFGDSFYETYSGYLSTDDGKGASGIYFVPGLCVTKWSPLVRWMGVQKYYAIYFWIRAVLFVWLPCGLLICLNIMLIRALHKAQRRRERLFSDSGLRQRERHKESLATSTMLVVIVSVFLVVNLPQGLFVALITADQALDLRLELLSNEGIAPLILMIDNMLIIATYPLNFAIYCSMSTLFRDTFKRLFCSDAMSPLAASRRASSFGYGSFAPIGGTVVPVVEDATAAATMIFDSSPRSDTALIQVANGRMYVVKDGLVYDTSV